MPKMTDQDFDNLFRQAANRTAPEPQPGDWEDMQRRLEAAERDARARNISLYSMVALLLLYSFIMPDSLKFGNVGHASIMPSVEQSDLSNPVSESLQPSDNLKGSSSERNAISEGQGSKTVAAGTEQQLAGSPGAQSGASSGTQAEASRRTETEAPAPAGTDAINKGAKTNAVAAGQKTGAADNTIVGEDLAGKSANRAQRTVVPTDAGVTGAGVSQSSNSIIDASGDPIGNTAANADKDKQAHSGIVAGTALVVTGTDKDIVGTELAPSAANAEKNDSEGNRIGSTPVFVGDTPKSPSTDPLLADPKQKPAGISLVPPGKVVVHEGAGHPWFIKLVVSPDFSSIGFGSAGKTGVNFGPMVEYGLSPRLGISTGAIWSKKLYDQKNPSKTYGTSGYPVHASMLNGDCRILDIPLNLTYYVPSARKTSVFITGGLSSYIMLKENYIYTVKRNNNYYEYEENYSHKNNEWFSMLNLSVGVQHQVTKRWFVQAEPFLKAPLKGIGEGKVNLVSVGVFASVKYRIIQ